MVHTANPYLTFPCHREERAGFASDEAIPG
jgi:hypothetical protein